ncbi:MAG: hypothetical protein ACR2MN_06565, partial [Acidimicrobiales bacterium]
MVAMTALATDGNAMGSGGMGGGPQVVDAHSILTGWAVGPFAFAVAVVTIAVAVWYLRAVRRRTARATNLAEAPPTPPPPPHP